MTNAQLLHRIGCENCDYTGTLQRGEVWGTCACVDKAVEEDRKKREEDSDEDNYMELYGIKKYE